MLIKKLDTKQSWLLILTGTYCVISVMMNYLCMKPMNFGTGFIWMDGGLLISWMVFVISNILVEAYGRRTANIIISIAAVLTLLVSCLGWLEVQLPTLPQYTTQAEHFAYIFSNGPRTIISSVIAFFIGSLIHVSMISKLKEVKGMLQSKGDEAFGVRAVLGTVLGQLMDNTLFQVLAFAPVGMSLYEMHWRDIWTAAGVSFVFEIVVGIIFMPFITLPLTKHIISLPATKQD